MKRPPRELLTRALDHVEWEGYGDRRRTAVEIGFGAGNESLELLRRGWQVLAVDREEAAARFLSRRVPARWKSRLTTLVTPMEDFRPPPTDLIFASFSLFFCDPPRFPELWASIRTAVRPGGHFAGVLLGGGDEWAGARDLCHFSRGALKELTRGWKVEMLRETVEEGRSFKAPDGWKPKHWHYFELILEKPKARKDRSG